MAKRVATSELNHDNWNKEEKPEDAGMFSKATPDIIQNRVIKSAKRRSIGMTDNEPEEKKSAFARFDGFKTNSGASSSSSPFKFLTNLSTDNTTPTTLNGSNNSRSLTKKEPTSTVTKVEEPSVESKSIEHSSEYYAKLKGLNESVSRWIQTHVDNNPLCILTPIFQDYERHLSEIESGCSSQDSATVSKKDNTQGSDPIKSFSFVSNPTTLLGKGTSSSKSDSSVFRSDPKNTSPNPFAAKPTATAVSSTSKQMLEGNKEKPEDSDKESNKMINPFTSSLGGNAPSFFSSGTKSDSLASGGFTFGSGKPFTFSNVGKPEQSAEESKKEVEVEEEDQPPKVEFTPVVEGDAVYSKRCKVFVKKDAAYQDRGVGTLYLKPVSARNKTQLIVRADTSLGNLLINTWLLSPLNLQKMGSNNVMLICIPNPEAKQPSPVLFRVKTASDADELYEKLKEYQK